MQCRIECKIKASISSFIYSSKHTWKRINEFHLVRFSVIPSVSENNFNVYAMQNDKPKIYDSLSTLFKIKYRLEVFLSS